MIDKSKDIELTDEQKQEIFILAKEEIDEELKIYNFFNGTQAKNLEDIIIEKTKIVLEEDLFKQFCDIFDNSSYAKIIDLTMNFVSWLFGKEQYDKDYYDKTCLIRKKVSKLEIHQTQDIERVLAYKKQFDAINHFYELAKNTQLKNDELTIENKKLKNIIKHCLAEIKKVLTQNEMQYVIKTIKGE